MKEAELLRKLVNSVRAASEETFCFRCRPSVYERERKAAREVLSRLLDRLATEEEIDEAIGTF